MSDVSAHTPDVLESQLELFMGEFTLNVKVECLSPSSEASGAALPTFSDAIDSSASAFPLLSIFDRDQLYTGPTPFSAPPTHGDHINPSDKMTVGKDPAPSRIPLVCDTTPRRIVLTATQADTARTASWVLSAVETLLELRRECESVWGCRDGFSSRECHPAAGYAALPFLS